MHDHSLRAVRDRISSAEQTSDAPENRRIAREVLERSLHAMNNLVVLTDPRLEDNPLVWVNDHFCEFTGYDRDEVIGRNCRFLQGDDRDQPARRKLREAVEGGRACSVVIRNYKKDGTLFYNHLYLSPVIESGEIAYFVGVQNDVTDRERALLDVRDRERELHEAAENERERFGMDLHDGLGQELTGIAFLAKALHQRLDGEASTHADDMRQLLAYIESAQASAKDMARGLNPVDASPHGLADALQGLCRQMTDLHPQTAFRCRAEPVAFRDRREARHLFRIAQEAVSNAAEHADASHIAVTLHRSPGAVQLEVVDDGRGIPEDVLEASQNATDREGMEEHAALAQRGMGLYGMRFRAELVGARLTIQPRAPQGTIVRCVLPDGARREQQHARTGERE